MVEPELLERHVGARPESTGVDIDSGIAGARDPKTDRHEDALREDDVRGLKVAMYDPRFTLSLPMKYTTSAVSAAPE